MEKVEKTVKFEIEKETKNTVKYNEVPAAGEAPIIEPVPIADKPIIAG